MSVETGEPVASPRAEVAAVPGSGEPIEEALLVTPNSANLLSAQDVLGALHDGSIPWLDEPLGWDGAIGYGGGPAKGAAPRAFRPSRSSSRGSGKE